MFFFEKKNQETLATWRTPPDRRTPSNKGLLPLFFRTEGSG
jgi:hypothetical protein